MPSRAERLQLKTLQAYDRFRLRRLMARHRGLEIDPAASSNLAAARYELAEGARLRIAAGVVTERLAGALPFLLGRGAEISVGEGTWLRTEIDPVHIVAFDGARIALGPLGFLNGCHLSAKRELRTGHRTWIGLGSRVFDSDQHDLDFKLRNARRFLMDGDKVKVTVMFRGREMVHRQLGYQQLDHVRELLGEIANVENPARMEGRFLSMILVPNREAGLEAQRAEKALRAADGPEARSEDAAPEDEKKSTGQE